MGNLFRMGSIGVVTGLVWTAMMPAFAGEAVAGEAVAGEAVAFAAKPKVVKVADGAKISFAVARPTDVEVAILAGTNVVRHLAAGVLGATNPPPGPLKAGLAQELAWDGRDDYGKPVAANGSYSVRVRTGMNLMFDRFIGDEPGNFGAISGIAADEEGNIYVKGDNGEANQYASVVRMFNSGGKYLREVFPFPADLPPGAMKDIARWDDSRKTFYPRNLKNLHPEFYNMGGRCENMLKLVSVSKKNGIVFSDGGTLFTLDLSGAVRDARFAGMSIGSVNNSGGGPTYVALSPDGKWVYLAGPFSNSNSYGYKFDPKFPPGRIYRKPLSGPGELTEFVTIPVDHKEGNGGAWVRAISNINNFAVGNDSKKGPVHQVVVDERGNVYAANREGGCVSVFDETGREIGKVAIKNPHAVAVHPRTGAIYVTQYDCVGYYKFSCTLFRFDDYKPGAKPAAMYAFPDGGNFGHSMVLAAGKDRTIVWMAGVVGGVVPLEDKGTNFVPVKVSFGSGKAVPRDWNRLAADHDRDEVYVSNGTTQMWRFKGATGEGELLRKDGKMFAMNDVAVGYDGLLYSRVSFDWPAAGPGPNGSGPYSGPFWRLDHELNPAPFAETGTHVLSKYVYGRYGIGFAERGIGVGPDGKSYLSCMGEFTKYHTIGFGPDGKPLKGRYMNGAAILAPIPQGNANLRVDWKGNIYIGVLYLTTPPPAGFEKDQAYRVSVGSVVKFSTEGGSFTPREPAHFGSSKVDGALCVYPGLAPFSSNYEGFGVNTCCACRVPRFDLDRHGRLAIPNAITCSVLLYDNAGNRILEFGKYGNFDSLYVNPNTETGKSGKPTVAVPDIPLAWPTGVGFTEKAVYVNDTYNRRVIRLVRTFNAEQVCDIE